MSSLRRSCGSFFVSATLLGLCSCTAPGGPGAVGANEFGPPRDGGTAPNAGGGDGGTIPIQTAFVCAPTVSSEPLPPRSTLISATEMSQVATMFTSDLFERFSKVCGTCHVQSNLGGFTVSPSSFRNVVTQAILDNSIRQDDPGKYMPPTGSPNGMAFSKRADTDPVKQLADLLQQWISQGSPADAFVLAADPAAGNPAAGYMMSDAIAAQITNIGTCVPEKKMVGVATTDMDRLDTYFAQADSLPATLDQTDLFTLDSAELAKNGVISFAPAYPLWTDNAGKMRFIRVPRGQAITFDKATQKFTIPANTRVYKTFLKPIVDLNGNKVFRKIETRMILSRPDTVRPDGTVQQNALYGTYVWNDDESQAVLMADPLNNGQPFADRLKTYITDEQKAQPIIDSKPADLEKALTRAGLLRHYALPGAERCVHCHMGSASASFILGFMPLQIARRPQGTAGVIEPAMGDELTQLQRFIDYGLIKGMASPDDVLPLDKSQGTRAPRNAQELTAQAYMLGNCSHCHNPRGFPTTKQPALKDFLNFLPSATGGIFQFPLDRTSPIRKRGLNRDVPIAYVTPSLYDLPSEGASSKFFCPDNVAGGGECSGSKTLPKYILAPWRSLVYRNVDTPSDYFDDFSPFPHMPLDSPGYDCRAAGILGDWMVSIPSKRKFPAKPQYADDFSTPGLSPDDVDSDPQPYVEVLPTDADYASAVGAAAGRVATYHAGHRYGFCPSSYTADIIDPVIQDEVDRGAPVSIDSRPIPDPDNPNALLMKAFGVPASPHWVNFDDTDPPGAWFPRRPDWEAFLDHPNIPADVQVLTANGKSMDAPIVTDVLTLLQNLKLDAATRAELTRPVPFGLWQVKPGCDFSADKKAQDFTGADRPTWMNVKPPGPQDPVYVQSAGAAVFTSICVNCHGEQADSKGLLADEISVFTGGAARVANFRDGLFGPVSNPGGNRTNAFSPYLQGIGGGVTVDDLAARYMAFMALGGTSKSLPPDVLIQVAQTPVFGVLRTNTAVAGTPDMLRLGLVVCQNIALASPDVDLHLSDLVQHGAFDWTNSKFGLINSNGDADLWLRLCNFNNRPIVRVFTTDNWQGATNIDNLRFNYVYEYWGAAEAKYWDGSDTATDWYGPNPVMDHRGQIRTGLTADNWFPMCVKKPTAAADLAAADRLLTANAVGGSGGNVIPYCPDGFVTAAHQLKKTGDTSYDDGQKWAARGAMNAALAVFLYLDEIERDPSKRQPLYNECELRGKM
ncbi:MAG TPA: hypothetical protein VHM31_13780 [Polyangia bacterium]|nr:hypothetical protein [Polyangia bacterium]